MFPDKNYLSSDLDWMMQNLQVSDAQLIQILTGEFYEKLFNLAISVTNDPEKATNAVEKTLIETVSNRRRYWGNPSLKAWMYGLCLRFSQEPQPRRSILAKLPFLSGRVSYEVVRPVNVESLAEECRTVGKEIVSLPPDENLLLFLHYVHGLAAPDVAYILKTNEGLILAQLQEIRQKVGDHSQPGQGAQRKVNTTDHHQVFRKQYQAALDQKINEKDAYELKQHLLSCTGCRDYAAHMAEIDVQIAGCLRVCWPNRKATPRDPEMMLAGMDEYVGKTRRQRRVSRLAKEIALVAAAIFLVIAVSSIGNLTTAEPSPTPPPARPMSVSDGYGLLNMGADPFPTRDPRRRRRIPLDQQSPPGSSQQAVNPSNHQILNFPPIKESWSPNRAAPDINMSGSVNLLLLLHFWGEQGNPLTFLQPNPRDETVMFYEMVNYLEDHTRLKAMMRLGGDLRTIKELLDAGIPVMVEKGYDNTPPDGWAGHYVIVNGYDDATQDFVLLAAYPEDGGDTRMPYHEFEQNWRAFNYSYLLVYPDELSDKVQVLLGEQVDEFRNYQLAVDKANLDIKNLTSSRDLFFAWFNKGTILTYQQDFKAAKNAFDQAFSIEQSLPEDERPWRMLWYQTRPYWAYFYTGDYQKVIDLATQTLQSERRPVLEESYYWRALAEEALGNVDGAIQDLNEAIRLNPNFIAGKYQLRRIMGES
jgi:tetratricopeptide (TPR) repeat protein/DNA-directed RNA polymerase specialized sigma24 family protein